MNGRKDDSGKAQWSLLPGNALQEIIQVLMVGAQKYAPDNWKKVPDARNRYFNALQRHMWAWFGYERTDAETGRSHLAHAACCLLFLLAMELDGTLELDLHRPEDTDLEALEKVILALPAPMPVPVGALEPPPGPLARVPTCPTREYDGEWPPGPCCCSHGYVRVECPTHGL